MLLSTLQTWCARFPRLQAWLPYLQGWPQPVRYTAQQDVSQLGLTQPAENSQLLARTQLLSCMVDLRRVPAGKQRQALQLQMRQRAPFTHLGAHVDWVKPGLAQVYYWDAQQHPEKEGQLLLPETALLPLPAPTDLACWQLDLTPTPQRLLIYRDSQGAVHEYLEPFAESLSPAGQRWLDAQAQTHVCPAPQSLKAWLSQPRLRRGESLYGQQRRGMARLPWLLLGLLLLSLSWSLGQSLYLWQRLPQAQAQLDTLYQQAEPLLDARHSLREIEARLSALNPPPSADPLALLQQLYPLLELEAPRLVNWQYRHQRLDEPAHLSVQLTASVTDLPRLIERLEAQADFSQVQAEYNQRTQQLDLQLRHRVPSIQEAR